MTTASNFEQTLRRLWGRKAYGKCQFIDELGKRCDGTAINSHTVQKSRALSSISERGHVYHITTPKRPAASGTRIFESIGIKKASIFQGFCGAHDKTLFSPIEDEIGRLNMSDLALLAYRCICQETFKKERAEAVYSHPDLLQAALNEGERVNAAISVFLGGTRRGLADLRKQKERIEKIVNTQEHDNCFAHIFEFSEELPLAFSAVFAPEFSFGEMRILPFGNDD